MSIAPPSPPAPPDDPRSILLDHRLGFRAIAPGPATPAVDDADACGLVLPRLAAAARDLAEADGSLGGVRPPSHVALGPDGSVYLLDRAGVRLLRFDPCECRFDVVMCLDDARAGGRRVRAPRDVAIACGNVYVCDADPQTARVCVFALRGFVLRGHLVPPPSERPWRPASVAADAAGRVWVGDETGRLHRFSASGAWERAWPMVPPPAHLAVDDRDRVYVVAPGSIPSLRVLDTDAQPVADAPTTPAEARRAFPHMPFDVDAQGRVRFACCPDVAFDASGAAVTVPRDTVVRTYERAATYRSAALDSGIAQCVWHRVVLAGALPPGARVRVRAFTADERLRDDELQAIALWTDCAVADALDDDGTWDCLVRAEPGRWLWLELALEGNGVVTPTVRAICVEFPRITLRRYLPAVFGMDPVTADFTDRFLALFDTSLRSIERQVDDVAALFDPMATPAKLLDWLGSWIGVRADRNWDVATRRRVIAQAGALLDRRGTLAGLREQLLLLLGFDRLAPCAAEDRAPCTCTRCTCGPAPRNCGPAPAPPRFDPPPLVLEHFRLRRWLRVGKGRLGDDAVVWSERLVGRTKLGAHGQAGVTRLDATPDPELDPFLVHANQFTVFVPARIAATDRARKAVENLVRYESPASARGNVQYVEPRFRIGVQSMLGFDTVVGAIPQGVTLGGPTGGAPLGAASVLTAPPHKRGGPAIALGEAGRIGTTTLLT